MTPPTHSVAHLVTRRPHPSQVALLVFAPNQRVTVYSSSPIEGLLQRFSEYKDTPEVRRRLPWLLQGKGEWGRQDM